MLRSISKQSRESVKSVRKKKTRLQWEGFAEKDHTMQKSSLGCATDLG